MNNFFYRGKTWKVDVKVRQLGDTGITELSKKLNVSVVAVKTRLKTALVLVWDHKMSRTYVGVIISGDISNDKLFEILKTINNSPSISSKNTPDGAVGNDDVVAVVINGMPTRFLSGRLYKATVDMSIEEKYDVADVGLRLIEPTHIISEKGLNESSWL